MAKKAKKQKADEDKANTCARVMKVKNKHYGDRVLVTGDDYGKEDRPRLQSGIYKFTWATGGGYPLWIPTKFVGPESGGKSSTAYNAMKLAGMTCWRCFNTLEYCTCSEPTKKMLSVNVNPEGDIDIDWLDSIGVPRDSYMVSYGAPSGEAILDIANAYVRADDCGLVIIDSLAMLTPESSLDVAIGEYKMADQARLLTDAMKKIQFNLNKERLRGHPVFVILTNQMRTNLKAGQFGNPESEAGGKAIRHWMSLGVRVSAVSTSGEHEGHKVKETEKDTPKLQKHTFRIKKHRLRILHNQGEYVRALQPIREDDKIIHKPGAIIDQKTIIKDGLKCGAIEKNPGSYECGELFKCKTKQDILDLILENENVYYQLQKAICDEWRRKEGW